MKEEAVDIPVLAFAKTQFHPSWALRFFQAKIERSCILSPSCGAVAKASSLLVFDWYMTEVLVEDIDWQML